MLGRVLSGGLMAALFLSTLSGLAVAEPKIGIASATKNEVQGVRGDEKRELETGSEIFLNEAVRTGDESVAQLVFLDNTNLSVGPGSFVQLDKFIYDPNRGTREVIFEVGRGAFRFATGSRGPKNYTVRTHVATMGIRGTVFELVSTDGEVKIKLNEGLIQVRTNLGQIVWLTRPETLLTVSATGTVHGPVPFPLPLIQFARFESGRMGTTAAQGRGGTLDGDLSGAPRIDRPSFDSTDTAGNSATQSEAMPFGSPFSRNGSKGSPKASSAVVPISPSR
jgi:hypothetical protein